MRRLLAIVVVLAGVFTMPISAAAKEPPERFDYHSIGLSASWRQRQPLTHDVYRKSYWYVEAYVTQDRVERLWSVVSRYQYRCERREDAPDRCKYVSRTWGVERDTADVELSLSDDLESAAVSGSFRLRRRDHQGTVRVGAVDVSARLTGRGEVYRSKSRYTNWDGTCPESKYRFTSRYQRAWASVSIAGSLSAELPRLKRASMSEYEGHVLYRHCD